VLFFQEEKNPEKKAQLIKDNCDEVLENYSYTKKFTPDELDEFKDELSEVSIEEDNLQEELKELSKGLKEKIKPKKEQKKILLKRLREKSEMIKDSVYVLKDEENYCVYNSEGELITSRKLKQSEKQKTIFQTIRKTGTNN